MSVTVATQNPADADVDLLAVLVPSLPDGGKLSGRLAALDGATGGRISELTAHGDFGGKKGQTQLLVAGDGVAAPRILLIGLGDDKAVDADGLRAAAGTAARAARKAKGQTVGIVVPAARKARGADGAQALAEGVVLGLYRFDRYQRVTEDKPDESVEAVLLVDKGGDVRGARAGAKTGVILADSRT